jgi:hypothetical protein
MAEAGVIRKVNSADGASFPWVDAFYSTKPAAAS